jgi:hypothetical protein
VDVEREVVVCGRARRDVTRNQMEMNYRPPRPGECGSSHLLEGVLLGVSHSNQNQKALKFSMFCR